MRLIDADALHEKMCERMTRFHALGQARVAQDYNFVATVVGNTPTVDAVPVVRCRECENWKPYGSKAARKLGDPLERYGGCEICSGGRLESDFCSYGRTREVGK